MPSGGGDDEGDSSDDNNNRLFDFVVRSTSTPHTTAQAGDAPAGATLGTDAPEVLCLCGKPAPHIAGKPDATVYAA